MKFIDLVSKRESVRGYLDKQVEIEKIKECVEAVRLAPSACNAQPWTLVVVNEKEKLELLRENIIDDNMGINKFVESAPVIVAIVSQKAPFNPKSRLADVLKVDYTSIDVGIAAEHFCLQATELSLGTCIIGWFNEENIKNILNIPSEKNIKLLISLGYPKSEEVRKKTRKSIEEIMKLNSYE